MRRLFFLAPLALTAIAPAQRVEVAPTREIDERLVAASRDGELEGVRALLAKGADPNDGTALAEIGGSPARRLALARLLVAKGAKLNRPGIALLARVIGAPDDSIEVVRFLVEKGANVNAAEGNGWTALHSAVDAGFPDLAAFLLAHGARIDARTNDRDDPSHPAADADDDAYMRQIKKEVNAHNEAQNARLFEPGYRDSGVQPFHGLANHWNPAMADLLIKAGANPNARDDNGWTVFHLLAHVGNPTACAGLAARGADPNAASNGGYRPLHLALRRGFGMADPSMIRALIAVGADPKAKNKAGQTPYDLLRADAEWRVGNPAGDPREAFPPAILPQYQALVDAAAKALEPSAAPIVLALPRPNPQGQRYAPLDMPGGKAERSVRVEGDAAILTLRLPPLASGVATLTIYEAALEEYDTMTSMPLVVRRTAKTPVTLTFRFPTEAAKGGEVNLAAEQVGPGNSSSGMGITDSSTGATDQTHRGPSFWFPQGGQVALAQELDGRTLEVELVSVVQRGQPIPGLAGRRFAVSNDEHVPIPGLSVPANDGTHPPTTELVYRFRYRPNVKWRKGQIAL